MLEKKIEKGKYFYIQFVIGLLIFLITSISLLLPNWFQSQTETGSKFHKIGLWEVCFEDFFHDYYHQKEFNGCFYVFYYKMSLFQSWLTPGWFIATQVIYTLAYIAVWICNIILFGQAINMIQLHNVTANLIVLPALIVAAVGKTASLIIFGVGASNNPNWMPLPNTLILSFCYWILIPSIIATIVLFILRWKVYQQSLDMMKKEILKAKRKNDNYYFDGGNGEEDEEDDHDGDGQSYAVPSTRPPSVSNTLPRSHQASSPPSRAITSPTTAQNDVQLISSKSNRNRTPAQVKAGHGQTTQSSAAAARPMRPSRSLVSLHEEAI